MKRDYSVAMEDSFIGSEVTEKRRKRRETELTV